MLTAASAAASYSAVPSSKLCLGCRRDGSPAPSCGTLVPGFQEHPAGPSRQGFRSSAGSRRKAWVSWQC